MKKFFFIIATLATITVWGTPYHMERSISIPGAYFLTPALSSPIFAIFGYIGKAKPTPEEIDAEKMRIQKILDNCVKQGYDSWENYEKETERAGSEIATKAASKEPEWVCTLLPPSLIKEAVSFFLKSALIWVKAHPEAQIEPFSNAGETGIIIFEGSGRYTKIPIGVDQPVVSIEILPDKRRVAVLCNMSTEYKKGYLHIVGRISLIDLNTKKVYFEQIFANACDELHFSLDGRRLAFPLRDPAKYAHMVVRFLNLKNKRLDKESIAFSRFDISGDTHGKKHKVPHFQFVDRGKFIAFYSIRDKGIHCYDINDLYSHTTLKRCGPYFSAAKYGPWIFDAHTKLYHCKKERKIFSTNLPHNFIHDQYLLAVDYMGCLGIDSRSGA